MPSFCTYLCSLLIGVPILLCVFNIVLLSPPRAGQDNLSITLNALKVKSMGSVRLYHIQQLHSLSAFSNVFSTLGQRAKYVNSNLKGEYSVARLPLGVWGTMASWIYKENAKRVLPWTGQRFIPGTRMTDPWGDNTYTKTVSEQMSRSDAFFATYDEKSHIDGQPGSIILDYGSHGGNGWKPSSQLMGELRCFNKHLCIGLTGFWFTGGAKNGIPYVLYRPGTISAETKQPKERYVPIKQEKVKPSKMKKKRMEQKKRMKERRGEL